MSVPKRGSVADLKKGLSELTQIKEDMVREGRREGGREGRREGGREGGGGVMTLDLADGDSGCVQQSVPPYL